MQHSSLSEIETGRRPLRVTELVEIAIALDTTAEELIVSGKISAGVAARAAQTAAESAAGALAAWALAVDRAVAAIAVDSESGLVPLGPPSESAPWAFMPESREVGVAAERLDVVRLAVAELARRIVIVPLPAPAPSAPEAGSEVAAGHVDTTAEH